MSNQSADRLPSEKKGQTLLKAGQMVLASTKPYSLLQEVGDEDQFAPVQNITTTYVDHKETNVQLNFIPFLNNAKNTLNSRASVPKEKTVNDLEYLRITSQIKNNQKAAARSLARRKQEKQMAFFEEQEEDLAGVQEIIGEIQSIMNATTDGQTPIRIKPSVQTSSRIKKSNWQSKPVKSFSQNDGFSKLEELLLNYKIDEQKITNAALQAQENLPATLQRRQRRQERLKRDEKYREITAELSGAERKETSNQNQTFGHGNNKGGVEKPEQDLLEDQANQLPQGKEEPSYQSVRVQDIEIVELDWVKLPVFLCPFTEQNAQLLLRMREYPDDPAFLEAISEILAKEHTYQGYSIFSQHRNVGIISSALVSEQEFREKWAEEWSHEVQDEENKQLLCQWDFQWYRSLVQLTYSHSLEEILMKSLKYDPQLYLENLKKLQGVANDKNKGPEMTIQQRIIFNRLKFVQSLLTKFHHERAARAHRKSVILGVVPNILHSNSQEQSQLIRQYVQQMFVGGLYAQQKGTSMAVLATLAQAKAARIVREGEGLVRIGEVDLLMKGDPSNSLGSKIVLKQERRKNSQIWIQVVMEGREEMVLEVGQQLHFGRRYRIDLD